MYYFHLHPGAVRLLWPEAEIERLTDFVVIIISFVLLYVMATQSEN